MKVLAIETSCDDTSLAIVSYDWNYFECDCMVSFTQIDIHALFWWVVPELASREHLQKIILVFQDLVKKMGYNSFDDFVSIIDHIVVTTNPWLPWSLIIWKTFGLVLSSWYSIPIAYVNHLHWHIFSFLLWRKIDIIKEKNLVLSVSWWHSDLSIFSWLNVSIKNDLILSIDKVWSTRDDAIGEVFDKVSRLLWWPYPWWVWISQKAKKYCDNSYDKLFDPKFHHDYSFKRILLEHWSFDFSFSGMKSQAYNFIERYRKEYNLWENENLPEEFICYLAYSFQDAATDILVKKVFAYIENHDIDLFALVWWVSANVFLREKIIIQKEIFEKNNNRNLEFYTPILFDYCTDNAAMIGVAGILWCL